MVKNHYDSICEQLKEMKTAIQENRDARIEQGNDIKWLKGATYLAYVVGIGALGGIYWQILEIKGMM